MYYIFFYHLHTFFLFAFKSLTHSEIVLVYGVNHMTFFSGHVLGFFIILFIYLNPIFQIISIKCLSVHKDLLFRTVMRLGIFHHYDNNVCV